MSTSRISRTESSRTMKNLDYFDHFIKIMNVILKVKRERDRILNTFNVIFIFQFVLFYQRMLRIKNKQKRKYTYDKKQAAMIINQSQQRP